MCPFPKTDMDKQETKLPFLLDEERQHTRHERKNRKKRLKKMLEKEKPEKKASLDRMLRLAAFQDDDVLDRQLDLYLERSLERQAHMVPSKETNTPPMWRKNMDYTPEEESPYFGSASEFLKKFPKGISEWRKWREKSRKRRERKWRIASLMTDTDVDVDLENFLKEAWDDIGDMLSLAHFVPEGGDDVDKLGDKEPKLWSDDPKWKSIGEFLKAHRKHYGQDADDAALKAARDFVKYWKLTTKQPGGNE